MAGKRDVETERFKVLIKYVNFWATELSFLGLLLISIFALLLIGVSNYVLDVSLKYFVYALIFIGFVSFIIVQDGRKSFEKDLDKL